MDADGDVEDLTGEADLWLPGITERRRKPRATRKGRGVRKAKGSRAVLEVTANNVTAIRLYDQVGFRRARVVYKAVSALPGGGIGARLPRACSPSLAAPGATGRAPCGRRAAYGDDSLSR